MKIILSLYVLFILPKRGKSDELDYTTYTQHTFIYAGHPTERSYHRKLIVSTCMF